MTLIRLFSTVIALGLFLTAAIHAQDNVATPDDDVAGKQPYSPTRLEWLNLAANGTLAKDRLAVGGYTILFVGGETGSDSMSILHATAGGNVDKVALQRDVESAERSLKALANELGWDWLKVVRDRLAEAEEFESDGDETFAPTRLQWMATVANIAWRKDLWDTAGYSIEFRAGPADSDTILIVVAEDKKRAANDRVQKDVELAKLRLKTWAQQEKWDSWLKIAVGEFDKSQANTGSGEGDKPYEISRLEWLVTLANATLARSRPGLQIYFSQPKAVENTIVVNGVAANKAVAAVAEQELQSLAETITAYAERKDWANWLVVKTKLNVATSDESDQVASPQNRPASPNKEGDKLVAIPRLQWLAMLANSGAGQNAWSDKGYRISFAPGAEGSDTLLLIQEFDEGRVDAKAMAVDVARARRWVDSVAREQGWAAWLQIDVRTLTIKSQE
jgi:hypothetical protein